MVTQVKPDPVIRWSDCGLLSYHFPRTHFKSDLGGVVMPEGELLHV
jgi:hypothetical protein